ncbi:hypothetical protein VU12_12475, partial [Desulfobulbus sp. US4]|nr:hypothetical protein [Desulfobulbus sp. US4]
VMIVFLFALVIMGGSFKNSSAAVTCTDAVLKKVEVVSWEPAQSSRYRVIMTCPSLGITADTEYWVYSSASATDVYATALTALSLGNAANVRLLGDGSVGSLIMYIGVTGTSI